MMERITTPEALERLRNTLRLRRERQTRIVALCGGTGCRVHEWDKLLSVLHAQLKQKGLQDKVGVRVTGCHGLCERGPLMVIHPQGLLYQQVKPEDVPEIVDRTLLEGDIVDLSLIHI